LLCPSSRLACLRIGVSMLPKHPATGERNSGLDERLYAEDFREQFGDQHGRFLLNLARQVRVRFYYPAFGLALGEDPKAGDLTPGVCGSQIAVDMGTIPDTPYGHDALA
jgi:hypothetical protein